MVRLLIMITVPVMLFAQGCTTAAIRDNPEKITDTGKRNTVVFSYDVSLQAFKRHPQAAIASASLCHVSQEKSRLIAGLTANNRCFKISASFKGTVSSNNGVSLETYTARGIDVHQMKYGDYKYNRIYFKILIDKQPELICTKQKVGNKTSVAVTSCRTQMKDIFKSYEASLPDPIEINVSGGTGCFLGHVSMQMTGNELTDYVISNDTDALDYSLVAEPIRDKVKSHVTGSCMT